MASGFEPRLRLPGELPLLHAFNILYHYRVCYCCIKNIKKRLLCIPYKYKILKVINKNTEYIYNLEKRFNRIFKQYKYKPLKQFSGQNECFKLKDIWI